MIHASLFTGIGGFDLAAQRAGFNNLFQVENNDFCNRILIKNFPTVKKYKDIKDFDGKQYRGKIDVISGGFPCQPYSFAGKRRGKEDDRSLWHEMFRVIKEIRPAFVVCENVPGIITMELDEILFNLESENYKTETFILPAISVNAPHIRNRVWIIAAYRSIERIRDMAMERISNKKNKNISRKDKRYNSANATRGRFKKRMQHFHIGKAKNVNERTWSEHWAKVAAELCRVDDGLPTRLDGFKLTKAQYRSERLKALGNSIVPQIAEIIFNAIKIYAQIQQI